MMDAISSSRTVPTRRRTSISPTKRGQSPSSNGSESLFRAKWLVGSFLLVSTFWMLQQAGETSNGGGFQLGGGATSDLYGLTTNRAAMVEENGDSNKNEESSSSSFTADVASVITSAMAANDNAGGDENQRPSSALDSFHLSTTSRGLFAPRVQYLGPGDEEYLEYNDTSCTPLPPLEWTWTKYTYESENSLDPTVSVTKTSYPTYYDLDEIWERERYVRRERPSDLKLMTGSLTLAIPDYVVESSNSTEAESRRLRSVKKNKRSAAAAAAAADSDDSPNRSIPSSELSNSPRHPRHRVLMVSYQPVNETKTNEHKDSLHLLHTYAKLWGHDVLTVHGSALPKYITKQGVRHICEPSIKADDAHILSLLRIALTKRDEYEYVMFLDPDSIILDLGRDVSRLLPSKQLVAARGKESTSRLQDLTVVSIWNLHHPLMHPIVVDWAKNIIRGSRHGDLENDDLSIYIRTLIRAGKLWPHLTPRPRAFHRTVVRTFQDKKERRNATEYICKEFAPVCASE